MFFLIKLALVAISASFFLAVTSVALAGFLVLTGEPKACVDRAQAPAPEVSAALQQRWLDAVQRVALGETVQVAVTELEATSVGVGYLEAHDVPLEALHVYFCPDGSAEAMGTLTAAGLSSKVLVKGHLDVDGDAPRIELDSVRVGNFPGIVGKYVVDLLEKDGLRTLPLAVHVTAVQFEDGDALLTLSP